MAGKSYYQYGTSPRKIVPEYNPKKPTKKETYPSKTTVKKKTATQSIKKTNLQIKKQKKEKNRQKLKTVSYIVLVFAIFLAIGIRNAQINEVFINVENLKEELSLIQKENEQLKVNIENELNLSNVEQQAKALLGMQKLQNDQKVYIDLDKKDYIEPSNSVNQKEGNLIDKIVELCKNIW